MIPLSLHSTCNSSQTEESPLHNCAPPFAFIWASIQSLEREKHDIRYTIYEKYRPFLWSSSFFVIFNFSRYQFWAPTYGMTHCCTPPGVPPGNTRQWKRRNFEQSYSDNFVVWNIGSHKVLFSLLQVPSFLKKFTSSKLALCCFHQKL